MIWSTNIPTIPGYYWVRGPNVKPFISDSNPLVMDTIKAMEYYSKSYGRPLEFAGPIPLPDESRYIPTPEEETRMAE